MEGIPAPAFPSAFMKTIVSLTGAGKPIAILSWERNVMGKLFQTFTPCGPVITTKDEISDPHNLLLEFRLNGRVMQSTLTDDLIFNIP
jgi:hypothetical protein